MVTKQPTISSIVVTKDRKAVVDRAIQSILGQTYPPTEIIIVDDGSRDGTNLYLTEKYGHTPSIRILKNETSTGPAAARNRGIHMSTGEFIVFLDDDDEWHPDKLAKQVALAKKGYEFITCTKAYYHLDNISTVYGESHQYISIKKMMRRNIIINVTPMVKKKLLDGNTFNPNIKCGEDYDLWLRLLLSRAKTININEPLITLYKTGNASLNQSRKGKIAGRWFIFRSYKHLMSFCNKVQFLFITCCKLILPDPRYLLKKIEHKLIRFAAKNIG